MCERLLAHRTNALIVMNREDLRLAVRYKLYSQNVYFIKGMGVKLPLPEFSRGDVRRELLLDDRFVITFVGELSKRKNQELLIRALPRLLELIPRVHLLLVGDGGERGYLEKLARELGVLHAVSLVGHSSEVPRLLSATDLYASPSLSEGLPFNVVEALSLGLTVLISNVKGHSDIVDDGVDGFLFKNNNITDFVNKTYQIYSKSIKINPNKAIAKAKQFSYNKVYLKTLSIIRKEIRHANLHLRNRQG
jgi:glycosyltransferase EpsD